MEKILPIYAESVKNSMIEFLSDQVAFLRFLLLLSETCSKFCENITLTIIAATTVAAETTTNDFFVFIYGTLRAKSLRTPLEICFFPHRCFEIRA